ncbi:MAG TPA: ABC transporter permease [Bryobacteraceae bacterium]|nr:ABC transporter permease [Bryobacteraceae bacterium]
MTAFLQDIRYAFRLIRKAPLFAFYVIAPLALGIGLNGAIFLLVDALLLRPLPVKNPNELVRLVEVIQNLGPRSNYTYNVLEALEHKSTTLTQLIGYVNANTAVRDSTGVSRIRCQIVTGNFFTALGVQPLAGRVLTASDALAPVGAPPVVASYQYWSRQLRADPSAVNKIITLDDRAFTLVGVMPRGFNGIEAETSPEIYAPLIAASAVAHVDPDATAFRKFEYSLAARLRPGVNLASAQAETASIVYANLKYRIGKTDRDEHLELQPIANGVSLIRPKFASGLILLISGVGLLLLMICANVGGLLLARASARRAEIAARLAIGATRGRLIRQWLTESLILTLIGGAIGIALAFAAAPLLIRALPPIRDFSAAVLTLSLDLRPDARLLIFAAALCILSALFAGFPAALEAGRASLQSSLKSSRGTARQPFRWMLVSLQIGLCTFLLAGAGLLVSTFRNLRALDPGFDRDHIVTFALDPEMAHYTVPQAESLRTRLISAVRNLPDVEAAGAAVLGLMHGTGMKTTIALEGQITPQSDFMNCSLNYVSAGYFETMRIPLLSGRLFRADEPETKPLHVVVNRAFVRRFFPSADAVKKRFGMGVDKIVSADLEIIGVVGDAKYRSLREVVPPTIYNFQYSDPKYVSGFILHVRTKTRPETIIQSVRRTLNQIDPRLPFFEIRTLAEEVDATLWAERLLAWLSGIFAIVASVLATLGVYATLAYAIAQSRREIGIRVALGARASDVLRLFSARPMRFAAIGILLGLAGFYAATPAFRSMLYEVSSTDPVTVVLATAAVLTIALAATVIAVSGALRVDPAIVLRDE